MEPRNFDAEREGKPKREEGFTFTIGGREWHTKTIAPPAAMLRKEPGMTSDIQYIRSVLVADERDVFMEMVLNPDLEIDGNEFDELAVWLIKGYSNSARPTESSG